MELIVQSVVERMRISTSWIVNLATLLLVHVLDASSAFSLEGRSRQQVPAPAASPSMTALKLSSENENELDHKRRSSLLSLLVGSTAGLVTTASTFSATSVLLPSPAWAAAAALQDTLDVDTFLRTGMDIGGNMGVSSQAGKSRPLTGVVFRDGTDVSQDGAGNVLAELLVGTKASPTAVLTTFQSPWPLATGPVYDVETRDASTGDGVFLAVTKSAGGRAVQDLPSSFFLERLFAPTGRFSFYGPPTDIKVKKSNLVKSNDSNTRYMELSFSTLSQATNAEIPRKALLAATIPAGTDNAIMLVGSASTARWNKGASDKVKKTIESFHATPAPKTNLKLRPKERGQSIDF